MCGLTAILIKKKYKRKELNQVKRLFTQILLEHEERGREATGVITIWPDSKYNILKKSIPARKFVKTSEYLGFLKKWDKNVRTVLGHTRKPTKGSTWNTDNNHPIIIGDTVGIHNGTIKNDDQLFKRENLERKAEVDSEVIFSMLDNIRYDYKSHRYMSDIQKTTRKMKGSFTTISVNLKRPQVILLLKYDQPLSFHYSKSLETFFFTSRYIFLRKAFGRSVVTEALPSKSGYIFDLFSDAASNGKPLVQFPITSSDKFRADDSGVIH